MEREFCGLVVSGKLEVLPVPNSVEPYIALLTAPKISLLVS
jgi:hypothetical protein